MKLIKFDVPNSLPVDDAKTRIEALLAYWSRKYGIKNTWTGGVKATLEGKAMGITFDGGLEITAAKILGEATDPGMLLRGQAQKYLTRKFAEYLDPKKSLAQIKSEED